MWHAMAVYGYMTITCNAAISACGKGREWSRALDVLNIRGEKDDKGEKGEKSNNDDTGDYIAPRWPQDARKWTQDEPILVKHRLR